MTFVPSPSPDPDSSRERSGIAALALVAFALNLNTNVLGPLLPFLQQPLQLQPGDDKLLLAAAGFGSAAGALVASSASRRFDRRSTLVGGLMAFVLASLAHGAAGTVTVLVALRAVAGVAVGLAYAIASALAAELAPYGRRGAAMGRFNAGMFLAIPLGLPLSVWLAGSAPWWSIFVLQAAVAGLGLWWVGRTVPMAVAADDGPGRAVPREGHLLLQPGVIACLLATMLHVGSFFVTVQLASTWLDARGYVGKERQLWLWVGLGVASVVGSLWWGRLGDRFGKRNFVAATSVLLVAGFLFAANEPAPLALAATGTLVAAVAAARTGPLQALLSGLVDPSRMTGLMAWRGFAMQAGVGLFALAAGQAAARLSFPGVLMLAGACQAGSCLLVLFGVRERRRATA